MDTEKKFIDEVISGEFAQDLEIARVELLQAAYEKMYDERTLEDWRVMFFEEQKQRVTLDVELEKQERLLNCYRSYMLRIEEYEKAVDLKRSVAQDIQRLGQVTIKKRGFWYDAFKMVVHLLFEVSGRFPQPVGGIQIDMFTYKRDISDIPF